MTVTSTSYDAKVSAAVCDMLDACATWGTGSIVEDWGGLEAPFKDRAGASVDTSATWAIVKLGPIESEQVAADTIIRRGTATIYISQPIVAGDTSAETLRRARNLLGSLCDELRAQLGASGKLMYADFNSQTPLLTSETGAAASNVEMAIEIAWRETP